MDALAEIKAQHEAAQSAYARKDLTAYLAIFCDDLKYTPPNRKTIGKTELARDVAGQFRRLHDSESSYTQTSVDVSETTVVEVATQAATLRARAFVGLLKRTWRVHRVARYVWKKTAAGWQICEVDVLEERVTASNE